MDLTTVLIPYPRASFECRRPTRMCQLNRDDVQVDPARLNRRSLCHLLIHTRDVFSTWWHGLVGPSCLPTSKQAPPSSGLEGDAYLDAISRAMAGGPEVSRMTTYVLTILAKALPVPTPAPEVLNVVENATMAPIEIFRAAR